MSSLYVVHEELQQALFAAMDAVQQTHGACETLHSLEEGLHGLEDELHSLEEGLHGLEDELHSLEEELHGLEEGLHSLEEGLHGLEEGLHSLEEGLHGLEEGLHGLEEGLHGLEEGLHSMEVQEQVARHPHGHLELVRQPVHCLSLFGQAPTNATLHSWLDVPANRCVRRYTRIDLAGVFRPGQPRPNVSRSASGWSVHHG